METPSTVTRTPKPYVAYILPQPHRQQPHRQPRRPPEQPPQNRSPRVMNIPTRPPGTITTPETVRAERYKEYEGDDLIDLLESFNDDLFISDNVISNSVDFFTEDIMSELLNMSPSSINGSPGSPSSLNNSIGSNVPSPIQISPRQLLQMITHDEPQTLPPPPPAPPSQLRF